MRTEEILRIRLDGAEFWDVREYVREKEADEGSPWKLSEGDNPLSDPQLWRYIAKADKLIAESCRASRRKLLRRHLAQRRSMYARSMAQGDIRTALSILQDEAKLEDLYPATKLKAEGIPGPGVLVIGGIDESAALGLRAGPEKKPDGQTETTPTSA